LKTEGFAELKLDFLESITPPLGAGGLFYQTFGTLNTKKNNVVWIIHALTANADVIEWWSGLVGKGKTIDTDKYFVVCANNLGSCYGSTNPLSINPLTNEPYYYDFPLLTTRDLANALEKLRIFLEIEEILLGMGGSQGGQILQEWAILNNKIFKNLFLIATNAKHSAWGQAFNESQRLAIENDHTWGQKHENAGKNGMKVARSIALLSYRNYDAYHITQNDERDLLENYKATTYQRYQGEKLYQRFHAFSYYWLSKAMDSHNVGRGRESIENALAQITAKTIVVGISSDILFPISEQKFLAKYIPNAQFYEIHSDFGHDGFLLEYEKIGEIIMNYEL
jgi:homoserine O-acetyltransferase/O-succinyltransferase